MIDSVPTAIRYIREAYGHVCEISNSTFVVFGENPAAGTTEATLQEFGGSEVLETFSTSNDIDGLVCSDDAFTGNVYYEGHYFDGSGDKISYSNTIAITGNTRVALPQALGRINRLLNISSSSITATKKVYGYASGGGTVGLTAGVPDTASTIKIVMSAEENASLKCSTAISKSQYALIASVGGGINKKNQGGGIFRVKIRSDGEVFHTCFKGSANSLGPDLNRSLASMQIITPNSDIMMTAETDATTGAWGCISGFLLDIKNI